MTENENQQPPTVEIPKTEYDRLSRRRGKGFIPLIVGIVLILAAPPLALYFTVAQMSEGRTFITLSVLPQIVPLKQLIP